MHPGRHIALCDSGTPAPHRLGACAQSSLHYPYARLSRQRLLLWPIREHYPLLQPETLALWVPDISAVIKNKIDSHCCCQQQRCNAETHLTAQALRHALMRMHGGFSHEQKPSTLWLQGQSLVMLSLVLDEHREDASCLSCHFNPMERQKLLRAKDLLLADLTQAPGVAELARESGLSVLKIKRGFRVLFNNSVYGLFQAERMQEARRRLANGNTSVMTVAADLGYANASHFSAAFQKQFGVTPSTFKRGM